MNEKNADERLPDVPVRDYLEGAAIGVAALLAALLHLVLLASCTSPFAGRAPAPVLYVPEDGVDQEDEAQRLPLPPGSGLRPSADDLFFERLLEREQIDAFWAGEVASGTLRIDEDGNTVVFTGGDGTVAPVATTHDPACQARRLYQRGYRRTSAAVEVYVEDGRRHEHDPNATSTAWECSEGCRWREVAPPPPCPSCGGEPPELTPEQRAWHEGRP
jgi:hypothetical protein